MCRYKPINFTSMSSLKKKLFFVVVVGAITLLAAFNFSYVITNVAKFDVTVANSEALADDEWEAFSACMCGDGWYGDWGPSYQCVNQKCKKTQNYKGCLNVNSCSSCL